MSPLKELEVYIDFLHCNAYDKHHQKQPKARWLHLGPAVTVYSGAGGCRRISCRRISCRRISRKNIAGFLCAADCATGVDGVRGTAHCSFPCVSANIILNYRAVHHRRVGRVDLHAVSKNVSGHKKAYPHAHVAKL